jgi:hypothetical protein
LWQNESASRVFQPAARSAAAELGMLVVGFLPFADVSVAKS